MDEKTFLKRYARRDEEGNLVYDANGNFMLEPGAQLQEGKYLTFEEDIRGLSENQAKRAVSIESFPGMKGYERYEGQNYRVDFDLPKDESKLAIPSKTDLLNDIGGPRALGGARQRVTTEPLPIGSGNTTIHRYDDVAK